MKDKLSNQLKTSPAFIIAAIYALWYTTVALYQWYDAAMSLKEFIKFR